MISTTIFGTWQLTTVSDNYPPISKLGQDIPISAYLMGSEGEEFIIRQSDAEGTPIEEILLTYRCTGKAQLTRAYQLGKWNIEKYGSETVGAILVGTSPMDAEDLYRAPTVCKSFIILRYGHLYGVQSSERISLNVDGSSLVIEVELSFAGVQTTLVKYLRRKTTFEATPLKSLPATSAWLNETYRSANILKETTIKFVRSYSVNSPSAADIHNPQNTNDLCLTRRIGDQITDGSTVVVFLFEITCRGKAWRIIHRYKEFDALKLFITFRKKPLPAKYWKDSGTEPSFPGKWVMTKGPTAKSQETRAKGLLNYLKFHTDRGGHDIPAIIDTLCSFLEIPEHMYEATSSKPSGLTIDARGQSFNSVLTSVGGTRSATIASEFGSTDDHSLLMTPNSEKASPSAANTTAGAGGAGNTTSDSNKASLKSPVSRRASAGFDNSSSGSSTITPSNKRASTNSMVPTSIYEEPANFNDFPSLSTVLPMAADPNPTNIPPLDAIYSVLSQGIIIIKHGRQGRPQRRLLRCNEDVSRLFWQEEPSARTIEHARAERVLKLPTPDATRSVYLRDVFSIRRGTEYDYTTTDGRREIGTATLRKNKPSASDLELCFSLMMTERTLDIQCLKKADFDFLYCNFRRVLEGREEIDK